MNYYTGIGSRDTPQEVLASMELVGQYLHSAGYVLRSGKAKGADAAFQLGVQRNEPKIGDCEIYIPWPNFKGGSGLWGCWDIHEWPQKCYEIASKIHPAWDKCSSGAKKLHARNVCQVLGHDLDTPSDFVVFYAREVGGTVKGGTTTAVNLAREYDIPTVNMFHAGWRDKLIGLIRCNVEEDPK